MASPSSSATTPSPPLAYMQASTVVPISHTTAGDQPGEQDEREAAVQKFLARAEVSKLTLDLRARLAYASYKAVHKVPHIPIRELEVKTQAASSSRSVPTKRKAGGAASYYNAPTVHSGLSSSFTASPSISQRHGSMAPPPPVSRTSSSGMNGAEPSGGANASQSLYESLLGPPPTKQARTIHNPNAPPVAAPSRTSTMAPSRRTAQPNDNPQSPRARTRAQTYSQGEGNRQQSAARRDERARSSDRPSHKGKERERRLSSRSLEGAGADEVDIKAAATLASILRSSRPSISGSTLSPRSSISAGSDASFSHFAQSSARTTNAFPTAESSFTLRSTTPPPLSQKGMNGTPKNPAPTDTEAADLMLYLATSPSPARARSNKDKDASDMAAFRALSGGGELRAKGRVLFPGAEGDSLPVQGKPLARDDTASFNSISSGGFGSRDHLQPSGVAPDTRRTTPPNNYPGLSAQPTHPVISPTSTISTELNTSRTSSLSSLDPKSLQGPPTPGNVPFNLNDFINVSPSPAAPRKNAGGQFKPGISGLRADVGRKLFDDEQHHVRIIGQGEMKDGGTMLVDQVGGLGAGIDLLKS
ncbi:hypothetical protein JAAARDRAFT_197651 [Jaapia argillacea MUCL 33604]|uniref:Uncharacterized protein n=1 Tax=Jaapia argillacea MUCL 33604 TaxID=933084 RepID=A0A067PE22_9AGAM|nr:hypothetical protein JAAARDRAFT_197651 [Jaapia argillacea MUCL 33604]